MEAVINGWIEDDGQQVPLRKVHTGLEGLDNLLSVFFAFFTPAVAGIDHSKHQNLFSSSVADIT
jgi:hypothetical protein